MAAEFDFPEDVVALRRAFDAADAKVQAALDEGGVDLTAARAERLDIVTRLYAHPWFGTVDQLKAREALKVAARSGTEAGE